MEGESINPYSLLQTIMLVYLSFLSISFSSVEYLTPPAPTMISRVFCMSLLLIPRLLTCLAPLESLKIMSCCVDG